MTTIIIYGASDDLVEVEGKVPGCDEYTSFDRPKVVVCEPSGDRFRVEFGQRGWTVTHEHASGALSVDIRNAPEDDEDDYSDRACVVGEIVSVHVWSKWPPRAEDYAARIVRAFGCDDDRIDIRSGITEAQTIAAWRALGCP